MQFKELYSKLPANNSYTVNGTMSCANLFWFEVSNEKVALNKNYYPEFVQLGLLCMVIHFLSFLSCFLPD